MVRRICQWKWLLFLYVTHDFREFDYFDIITDALDNL